MALIVSSYQKPRHLRMALASIARQDEPPGRFEVIVADDGSTDETPDLVEQFAAGVDFAVKFTTHPHATFQVSRCRNEGAAASVAPYLVFVDGDCIVPRDFVRQHLARRRPGVVMFGDRYCLDEQISARIDESVVRSGAFRYLVTREERRKLARWDRKARWYNLIRHSSKPRLLGGHFALWRSDYERVNGCDENFQGWGCEDDDLGYRLRQSGLQLRSIVRWTRTYHVWHPRDVTATPVWEDGANVEYLRREDRADAVPEWTC